MKEGKRLNAKILFSFKFIFLLLLLFLQRDQLYAADTEIKQESPAKDAVSKNSNCNWSYSVEGDIERSQRSYMLVYTSNPETPVEKSMEIISKCQKRYQAEGVYGKCIHSVHVQPVDKGFTLDTGEEVVQIGSMPPLFLATIQYGCCGGPDVVRFYTDNGEYRGTLKMLQSPNPGGNLITRQYDFGNVAEYSDRRYLAIETEGKVNAFEALVFDGTGKMGRVPIKFVGMVSADCVEWFLTKFVKFADKGTLTLEMTGRGECKHNSGKLRKKIFDCAVSENVISCFSRKYK